MYKGFDSQTANYNADILDRNMTMSASWNNVESSWHN